MSFKCAVTDTVVENQRKVMVPVLKRKVSYQKVVKRTNNAGETFDVYVGEPSEGWEAAKEFPTTEANEAQLTNDFVYNFEPEVKTVLVEVSKRVYLKERAKREESSPEGNSLQNYWN